MLSAQKVKMTNTTPEMLGWLLAAVGLLFLGLHLVCLDWRPAQPVPELVCDIELSLESSHAASKHGQEVADAVRACIQGTGPSQVWQRGLDRFLIVCRMPDGKWGVQVVDRHPNLVKEITAFLKEKFRSIKQLEQYFTNGQASKIWEAGQSLEQLPAELLELWGLG